IRIDEIDDQYPSEVSMMPTGLLDTLDGEEILDLLTFLRSGGDADHEIYEANDDSERAAATPRRGSLATPLP
ncbi:MAG: hypothetical protein AAF961_18985, partial [Planctomycetota bacterium]